MLVFLPSPARPGAPGSPSPETQENRTLPLPIVFDHVPHADVVEAAIRAKADPLARFFARILGCRVTVGLLQKHVGELRNGGNRSGIPPAPFSSSRRRIGDRR